MNTLYITEYSNILVDTENKKANKLPTQRASINQIYLAEEPMHVVYGCGEYHKELDVEKGDIIITFYCKTFKDSIVVVKNEDWLNNLLDYNKRQQEEKERWASVKDAKRCECDQCECAKCDNPF